MPNDAFSNGANLSPQPQRPDDYSQDELDALSTLVPNNDNDNVYVGWDNAVPNDAFDTIGPETGDAFVYGLDVNKPLDADEDFQAPKGPLVPLIAIASLFAVFSLLGFAVWRFGMHSPEVNKPVQTEVETQTKTAEVEEPVDKPYTTDDVVDLVCGPLFYEGADVSLEPAQVSVVIHAGKVMVIHKLPTGADVVPANAVRLAGIRANVLASLLTDKKVIEDGEEEAPFNELIWVLLNSSGDAFIAVSEVPGSVRTSTDPYGVLKGANAYVISWSLHDALGANAGIEATKGSNPNDPYGTRIAVLAELPKKEESIVEDVAKKAQEEEDTDDQTVTPEPTHTNRPHNTTPTQNTTVPDEGGQEETPGDSGDSGESSGSEEPGDGGEGGSDSGDSGEDEPPSSDEGGD